MHNKSNKELFCEDCGKSVNEKNIYFIDEYPYCRKCYYKNKYYKGIHDYDYEPMPVFQGEGNVFIKLDIGVNGGGFLDINAEKILNIANKGYEDNLYIKRDSRFEKGFLMVSQPMTLEYHKKCMPWEKIMAELVKMGYESHKTMGCRLYCANNFEDEKNNYNMVMFSELKGTLEYNQFIITLQQAAKNYFKSSS